MLLPVLVFGYRKSRRSGPTGYPVLPIQRSILSRPHPLPAPWLPTPSEKNVTNAPENIVRMKRGKIMTHYGLLVVVGNAGVEAGAQHSRRSSCLAKSPLRLRLLRCLFGGH